jgi:uncharacterized protein (DUF1501 family)
MSSPATLLMRRQLLQLGGWSYLGLNWGGLLHARAATDQAGPKLEPKIKSCILIFYYGGPSHLDTFDPKPDAPAEIRGEFRPITTSVPGLYICEHLPRLARLMDKICLIRSMHHANRLHDSASTEVLTGRPSPNGDREEFAPIKQFFPCFGATLSYLRRRRRLTVSHAALPFVFHNVIDVPCQGGGFLGSAFDPLPITVQPQSGTYHAGTLALPEDIAAPRLRRRRNLLESLDSDADDSADAATHELRRAYQKAYDLLHSNALRNVLDLSREDVRVRERFGFGPAPLKVGEGGTSNGAEFGYARQMRAQNLLLARRLVEAGVPFVNVYDFYQQGQNWDAHFQCADQHKRHLLPLADQGLSALIEDLAVRGLLDSTLVVAMGEFGRTPRINRESGRDHWPDCYTVLLAGGGVKGGFVHGASDRIGAYPAADPVAPADLAATIFWRFGIDPASEIRDALRRPFKIADGEPLQKLFSDST